MWNKKDETPDTAAATPTARPAAEPRRSGGGGGRALIGESVRVEGTITGSEDLLIEGEVEGTVKLLGNSVTVGRGGRVKADIHGRVLVVEGNVRGDLFAEEQAVVRASGEVRGNITSPRVSLEDGAKFKGSIDMEPKRSPSVETKSASSDAAVDKPRGAAAAGGSGSGGGGDRGAGSGRPGGGSASPGGGSGGSGGSSGGSGGSGGSAGDSGGSGGDGQGKGAAC